MIRVTWPKYLTLRAHVAVSPEGGKRRVWTHMSALETQLAGAQERIATLEGEISALGESLDKSYDDLDDAYAQIDDLKEKLAVAYESNEINMDRVRVVFGDLPSTYDLNQATYPIDIRELRTDLEEPIVGKVMQLNPETGDHETVETEMDALQKKARALRLSLVMATQHGVFFADPTHVPGMKVS